MDLTDLTNIVPIALRAQEFLHAITWRRYDWRGRDVLDENS